MQQVVKNNQQVEKKQNPFVQLFQNRNFRMLWLGEIISLIGDQFYMIALPWLVLKMTGDALAVGTVLAVAGIPRALFMLVGGALTDRFSARFLMLASNVFRLVLVSGLAVLVFSGAVQLWMLYILALAFGLADAFFYPAQNAIVPRLVSKDKLQTANAIVQGSAQISLFLGPVLAGWIIARLGAGGDNFGDAGLGVAFGIDALTFLVSAITLWFIRVQSDDKESVAEKDEESVFVAIRQSLAYVWQNQTLRMFFIVTMAISTLMNGVMGVGLPVMADARFAEGAMAFGMMMSGYGAGSLIGTVMAGVLPAPPKGHLGTLILSVTSLLGFGLMVLSIAPVTAVATLITFIMGLSNGYIVILFVTWLQVHTPDEMIGRMMSLLMFASIGLAPVAQALVGVLIGLNMMLLFIFAGVILLVIVGFALSNPVIRAMSLSKVQ